MRKAFVFLMLGFLLVTFRPAPLQAQPAPDFATQAAAALDAATNTYRADKQFYIVVTAQSSTPQAEPYPQLNKKLKRLNENLTAMRNQAQSPLGAAGFNAAAENFKTFQRDFETISNSYGIGQMPVADLIKTLDGRVDKRRDDIGQMRDRMTKAKNRFDAATISQLQSQMGKIDADWTAIRAQADANKKSLKGVYYIYSGPGIKPNTMLDQASVGLKAMDAKIDQFEVIWKNARSDWKSDKDAKKKDDIKGDAAPGKKKKKN